jgi:hypothetical protein
MVDQMFQSVALAVVNLLSVEFFYEVANVVVHVA